MHHANFVGPDHYFKGTSDCRELMTVRLDSAPISSNRLSIVTMLLTETVWSRHKYFGVQSSPPFREITETMGNPTWYHKVAIRQPYSLVQAVLR